MLVLVIDRVQKVSVSVRRRSVPKERDPNRNEEDDPVQKKEIQIEMEEMIMFQRKRSKPDDCVQKKEEKRMVLRER